MKKKIEKLDWVKETTEREQDLRRDGFNTTSQEINIIEDKINEIIDYLNQNKNEHKE